MVVQQDLVLLIAQAEVLQELVGQAHELLHQLVVLLVVRILEEIEDDSVDANIAEQSLLMLAWLDHRTRTGCSYAKFVHADQNLLDLAVLVSLLLRQGGIILQANSISAGVGGPQFIGGLCLVHPQL